MMYIKALELINCAILNGILEEKDGKIFVYRKKSANTKEGWHLEDKDSVAKELMNSESGQKVIIEKLKKKNIEFKYE